MGSPRRPVLLLLELSGYEVPEVAIGIPSGAVPTAAEELVVVALGTMRSIGGRSMIAVTRSLLTAIPRLRG